MARIRSIKPEFWTDSVMVKLPVEARLLYIGLWNFADDYGVIANDPDQIKMLVFPGDGFDCEALLDTLICAERIDRYVTRDGHHVLQIRRFSEHQRVDHPAKPTYGNRETWRKLAIPVAERRALAKKYGGAPGASGNAECYYCGAAGRWNWDLRTGWVVFSGLEIDHFIPENDGGQQDEGNFVLACRPCNRSKGCRQNGVEFLESQSILAKPRETSRALAPEGRGGEGNGEDRNGEDRRGGESRARVLPADQVQLVDCKAECEKAGYSPLEIESAFTRLADRGVSFKPAGYIKRMIDGMRAEARLNNNGSEPERRMTANDRTIQRLKDQGKLK